MKYSLSVILCSAVLAWPLPANAAGDGGGGGGDAGAEQTVRNQDPDYAAGLAAVKSKDWAQAVERMNAYVKRKPDDANGWNQLGYSYRHMGQFQPALDAYGKAIKIDPKHRGAHEYLGEAYLQMGDLPKAEQQLQTLDKLCLFSCEEYRDLKKSIADYKKTKQQASTGS